MEKITIFSVMDINEFFGNKKDAQPAGQRPVAVSASLAVAPLLYGLEKSSGAYRLIVDNPAACSRRLKEGEVHLALIPSIDYAQGKGSWLIVPDLCVAHSGASKSICLFFNENVSRLRSVALNKNTPTEEILLKILLNERYQSLPEFIYTESEPQKLLSAADAALMVGDAALGFQNTNPHYIDLTEEWYDFTGLPFVASLWCGNELLLNLRDVERLRASFAFGQEQMQSICENWAKSYPLAVSDCLDVLNKTINYSLNEEAQEGLKEYFRYAFYLGFIDHIPDLHFWQEP